MTRTPESITYVAEFYCVFCQNDLPRIKNDQNFPADSVSESNVIGLANLTSDSSLAPQVHFFQTDLSDSNFCFLRRMPLTLKNLKGDEKIIRADMTIDRLHEGDINRPLLFIHIECWNFARKLKPSLSFHRWYELIRQLHHILPRTCQAKKEPWDLASFSNKTNNENINNLLFRCANLPSELQQQIWRYISAKSLIFRLLATVQTVLLASKSISSSIPRPICFRKPLIPRTLAGKVWLHATFISIFRRGYLQHIHFSKSPTDQNDLKINIDNISYVNFMVESLGISAIQIVYNDGAKSEWVGDATRGWRGSTIGFHIEDVQVLRDDFKLLSFNPLTMGSENSKEPPPSKALWNIYPDQSNKSELHVAQLYPCSKGLMHYQGWRLCQYLPFQNEGRPATGITVYNDLRGTNQVIVHGQNFEHRVAASDRGYPRYFHLDEGYRIVRLGLVRVGSNMQQHGPFLLMEIVIKPETQSDHTDNTVRTAFFGPRHILHLPNVEWLSLLPTPGDEVTGLIVDQLTSTESHLTTIGAHTTPQHQVSTCIQPNISIPVVPSTLGSFQTIAKLSNVRTLSIQRRNITNSTTLRCAGLCIHYTDRSIETLGQWDGSLTGGSEVIYDVTKNATLDGLTFQYGHEAHTKTCIVNIIAHTSASAKDNQERIKQESGRTFHWISSEQENLYWIFTGNTDEVGYYKLRKCQIQPKQIQCNYQPLERATISRSIGLGR